ncbi:MJ0042-type zinc finger domain-containing protein, partial [Ralstonia pseudosolanacearum]
MASAPRLAARCPACHTAFRVVADQLRLRGGLVRCGRCNHVFDGRAHLIELDTSSGESAAQAAAPQPPERHEPVSAAAPAAAEPHPAEPASADEDDHGFGITLTWEEEIAEVHLGEVEGAEADPGTQPIAPDTRSPAAPTTPAAPAAQAEPPKAKPST